MPPILFIHGLFHGGWCYEEHFIPWFRSRGYEAEAITLRHHDRRHAPGLLTDSIKDFVTDVAMAAGRMSSPPVLVGHSMGGFVTQKYLEDRSAPAAVLLASAPPHGILVNSLHEGARHPIRMLSALVTLDLHRLIGTPDRARALFFSDAVAETDVRRYQALMVDASFRVYLELLGFMRPKVGRIRAGGTPILVLHGDADRGISDSNTVATAKAYSAEVAAFPGQAHDLMLEPAWEDVAKRIDTFVKSAVPEGPAASAPRQPVPARA